MAHITTSKRVSGSDDELLTILIDGVALYEVSYTADGVPVPSVHVRNVETEKTIEDYEL